MLVAKPFFSYDHVSKNAPRTAPRVISAVRKVPSQVAGISVREPLRARISVHDTKPAVILRANKDVSVKIIDSAALNRTYDINNVVVIALHASNKDRYGKKMQKNTFLSLITSYLLAQSCDTCTKCRGNLAVSIGLDASCATRKVIIRGGYIHVALLECNPGFRLPLRHLSIRAGPVPFSMCLVKGQTLLLTLTIPTDRLFEIWLKTLAIEIIRQTPLESVKYLDILTLPDTKNRTTTPSTVPPPHPNKIALNTTQSSLTQPCFICSTPITTTTDLNRNNVRALAHEPALPRAPIERQRVAVLLQKCQSAESYVPVKEKLVLFESLCRVSCAVGVTDELLLASAQTNAVAKRARSMHDLSYCFTNAGVREICKYFETKSDSCAGINRTDRRLIHSDSNLNAVRVKFNRNLEAHA